MTSSSPSAECPVVAQGPFRLATINEIRSFAIGRAVVLTGPGVKRLISADEPLELMHLLTGLLTRGFTHYSVVDTTAKQTSRSETKRISSDPRYTYKLNIVMAARVADPVAYLDDFSPNASIFDAFYSELIEDVSNALADCHPDNMREAQQRISSWAASIRKSQPYHKGVQIQLFNISLEYGDELAQRIRIFDQMDMHEKFGDKFFIFGGAEDPTSRDKYSRLIGDLRDHEEHLRDSKHKEFSRGLEAAKAFHDVTGEDMHKIVQALRAYDSIGGLMKPPSPPTRSVSTMLPSTDRKLQSSSASEEPLPKFSRFQGDGSGKVDGSGGDDTAT